MRRTESRVTRTDLGCDELQRFVVLERAPPHGRKHFPDKRAVPILHEGDGPQDPAKEEKNMDRKSAASPAGRTRLAAKQRRTSSPSCRRPSRAGADRRVRPGQSATAAVALGGRSSYLLNPGFAGEMRHVGLLLAVCEACRGGFRQASAERGKPGKQRAGHALRLTELKTRCSTPCARAASTKACVSAVKSQSHSGRWRLSGQWRDAPCPASPRARGRRRS
jgi:hypothetical protein